MNRMQQSTPFSAFATGGRWNVLVWNAAAPNFQVDCARILTSERNILQCPQPGARDCEYRVGARPRRADRNIDVSYVSDVAIFASDLIGHLPPQE